MFRFCAVLSLIPLLTACGAPVPAPAEFPPGSALVLERTLTIPPDQAGIWIQDGTVQIHGHVDRWRPHCRFTVRSLEPTPRTVRPGRFEIRRVQREVEGLLTTGFSGLAALGLGDGPSPTPYITHLYLRSAEQPDVHSLSCQQLEDPTLGSSRHLSMAEIRNALAGVFRVQLAP